MAIGDRISGVGARLKRLVGAGGSAAEPLREPSVVLERTGFEGSLDGAEVIGRSPMSYLAASESVSSLFGRQTEKRLADYGVEDVQPDEWYPLAAPLAMLYDMREEYGTASMRTMGRHIPQHVEFPPDLSGAGEALRSIDAAYHQNHRGGEIGSYEFHEEGPGEGRMVCENPYPCELDQGLIRGVAQEFADSFAEVEEVGDQCRAEGGQRCEYRVEWIGK